MSKKSTRFLLFLKNYADSIEGMNVYKQREHSCICTSLFVIYFCVEEGLVLWQVVIAVLVEYECTKDLWLEGSKFSGN
jgi:hypothetical protein